MRLRRLLWCLCLCALPLQAAQDATATQAQLDKLRRDISSLQGGIERRATQQRTEERALADAEREIGRVAAEIRALDESLSALDSNMESLQSRRERLESELESRRVQINQLLREQYRQGRQPRMQLLLAQEDPEALDRLLHYYDRINFRLTEELATYQRQLDELGSTREEIGSTEQQMREQRQRLQEEHQNLSSAREKRAQALTALREAQRRDQQQLARLREDQQQLEKLLADIQRSLEQARLAQQTQAFSSRKGKLEWPVSGRVLGRYGDQRGGVAADGMLIGSAAGSEVRAVHHGRVVFSDWLRGYGLVLIIDHGSGYMSLYGHNQALLRDVGSWVNAGQPIATVGSSGGHEASALYFAIRHNGKAQNPQAWLVPGG